MKQLLKEMNKRLEYLESIEDKTDETKGRIKEITNAIVVVQQLLLKELPTTPPLSAESTISDLIDGVIFDLPMDSKEKLWDLIELYRSQPTPTPEISAEEYADNVSTAYGRDFSVKVLTNTITAIELAGVDATYYKNALEYLKGR